MIHSRCVIVLFLAALLLWADGSKLSTAAHGDAALDWQNYVVRFDRGWDVLCEPYEVQPDDWVLKIFAQKGEIAHLDFRDFLGIFKRLNPHIKDIDRIRPGQIIDIPLKKLTQGVLPGQSSGIVTIPYVSLNDVDNVLENYSVEYTIEPGDCVSVILAKRFGIYGSQSYSKGLKMFQALNPEIKNLDQIVAGQKIYVPAPNIQDQAWYESMFDSQGDLTDKIGMVSNAAESARQQAPRLPISNHQSLNTMKDSISQAASALEGNLLNKGTYFFPLKSGGDFELDLSRYPILEMKNGQRYILTKDEKIMGEEIEIIESMLPNINVVKLSEKQTTDQVIDSIVDNENSTPEATNLNISEHGTEIWLQAKWIEKIDSPEDNIPRQICIMPIESPTERTAPSIARYLFQHNIVLKEVLSDTGGVISAEDPSADTDTRYTIITSIASRNKKEFVGEFAQAMEWRFTPDVEISFPYANIQVQALSNMLSSNQGKELLIDFGGLYGDAIAAIEKNGLHVVQIKDEDTPPVIATKLLEGMKTAFTRNPSFMAAKRISPYNTTLKIDGFLLETPKSEKVLLATNSLNHKVVDFLESTGLKVIMLGQSKLFY